MTCVGATTSEPGHCELVAPALCLPSKAFELGTGKLGACCTATAISPVGVNASEAVAQRPEAIRIRIFAPISALSAATVRAHMFACELPTFVLNVFTKLRRIRVFRSASAFYDDNSVDKSVLLRKY
jgi:hypothetical protein